MRQLLLQVIVLLICIFLCKGKLFAHGGEDHGEKQKNRTTAAYFSSEYSSEKYEVLIKYGHVEPGKEEHLNLYLSDVNSNQPIANAKIRMSSSEDAAQRFEVFMKESGIYEIHTIFTQKKTYSLNVIIDAQNGADLIRIDNIEIGKELPLQKTVNNKNSSPFENMNFLYILIALMIGLGIGLFLKRKTNSGKSGFSILFLILFLSPTVSNHRLLAHGGEEHEEEKHRSGEASSQLLVAKETQFLFDVRTNKLGLGNFTPSVNLFGTILPTSSGKALVQTPQTGTIKSLNVGVGQFVYKGQLLASVEQNIDANTKVTWLTQKNALEAEKNAAKKDYDRLLSISDIVAKRDIEEAERRYFTAKQNAQEFDQMGSSNKNSKLILLYAPIDGKVDQFNSTIGSTVNAGQEILSITNLKMVYIEAQVFDKDIENVQAGKEYLVECTDNDNHKNKKVRLLTMSPSINSSNQSQRVLFEMDNSEEDFKIGEFVNIRVFKEADTQNITVPNSAITEINGKSAVFVKDAAEQYSLVYVSTGENNGRFTSIIKGLEENEKIVISGTYQLKMMYLNQ